MNSPAVVLLLRFVHIVAGVLWAGAAVMLAAYVLPAVRATGELRFLRHLIWEQRLPRYLNAVLLLALLSGLALYGNLAEATHGAWIPTHAGLTLGAGGLLALIAAGVATVVAAPAVHRALALAEGDATEAKRVEMWRALATYERAMQAVAALLLGTATAMAVARYLA